MIPYMQWMVHLGRIKEKGIRSEEFYLLTECCPIMAAEDQYIIVQKEMEKLEMVLLKNTMELFQKSVNCSLEDVDLEILIRAIHQFKKNINCCFFFCRIKDYPLRIRKNLYGKVAEKLLSFLEEYFRFLRKMNEAESSRFMEDFSYICQKAGLKKYVEGFDFYGEL